MNPDPDPAFQVNPESGSSLFLSKISIYLCPSYRRSLQPSKQNIQHLRKLNLLTLSYVCALWVIFALLDPDPDRDSGSGYGSRDPIKSGSNLDTDPDPQHCRQELHPAMTDLKMIDQVPHRRIIVVARSPCRMFSSCCPRCGYLFLQPLFQVHFCESLFGSRLFVKQNPESDPGF